MFFILTNWNDLPWQSEYYQLYYLLTPMKIPKLYGRLSQIFSKFRVLFKVPILLAQLAASFYRTLNLREVQRFNSELLKRSIYHRHSHTTCYKILLAPFSAAFHRTLNSHEVHDTLLGAAQNVNILSSFVLRMLWNLVSTTFCIYQQHFKTSGGADI